MIIEFALAGFVVWFLLRVAERAQRNDLLSSRECGYCSSTIFWTGDHWVHSDGVIWKAATGYKTEHAALPGRNW